MSATAPRNSILFLRRTLGLRLPRGTRVRLLYEVPARLARDATGEPLECDAACLCLLPDEPGFEQVVLDPEYLSAVRPTAEDDEIDEAAARAALVDALSGDADGPNAHIYDTHALGHTFEDEDEPSRGRAVVLEDDGGDAPAVLRPLVRRLDAHRGAFGEPETCLIGSADAEPDRTAPDPSPAA